MQLIEAALAFAITMLALSLVVSSFVEIIHRVLSMREAGLKYVLGQMFDQVLAKYVTPVITRSVAADATIAAAARNDRIAALLASARTAFVERMSANRAPMGVTPNATPADPAAQVANNPRLTFSLWGGRDLAAMTPAEFMERLGSIDVGKSIADANAAATNAAQQAGATAADAVDVVLKDVAQKFEAFGREASVYFEGRARLLSVVVAIALAFAAHVDAVDLFKTYLRDPNARAKVIEQSEAVTAQYKAAQETIKALNDLKPKPVAVAPQVQTPAQDVQKTEEEKKKEQEKRDAEATQTADLERQIETLKKDTVASVANARAAVKQFADLGVPLGWNNERIKRAEMWQLVWTCKNPKTGESLGMASLRQPCQENDLGYEGAKHTQHVDVWFQLPMAPSAWFYLFLGGLLVGLGAPFWHNAVTGLTNLRNVARGATSADAQTRAAAVAAGVGTTQPVTPVDAFRVSHAAQR